MAKLQPSEQLVSQPEQSGVFEVSPITIQSAKDRLQTILSKKKEIAPNLANEIDQKIFLFSAVGLTSHGEKYMQAKITIQYLSDYFSRLKTGEINNSLATDSIRFLSTTSVEFFEEWFKIEKKLIDDAHKRKFMFESIFSIFLLPYIFYNRFIKIKFHQFFSKPYFDPYASSFFPMMLKSIFSYDASNLKKLSDISSIKSNLLVKYSLAHKHPNHLVQEQILILARDLVSKDKWNDIVMENLSMDIRKRKLLVIWLDSVKADATMWLVKLTFKNKDDKKIEKLFFQLFNLNQSNINYLNR